MTNPAPINGNTGASLSADDDGGFFRQKARAYYGSGAMPLPASGSLPTATPTASQLATATPSLPPTATPAPSFSTSATTAPSRVVAGGTESSNVTVTSATPMTVLVDVEIYDPTGTKVIQQVFDNQIFAVGEAKSYPISWTVPSTAASGTYTVKIGIFSPTWGTLYNWNDNAARFSVTTAAATTTATSPLPLRIRRRRRRWQRLRRGRAARPSSRRRVRRR